MSTKTVKYQHAKCPSNLIADLPKYGLDANSLTFLVFLIDKQGKGDSSWYSQKSIGKALGWSVTKKGECRLATKATKALVKFGLRTWMVTRGTGRNTRSEKHYDVRPVIERLAADQRAAKFAPPAREVPETAASHSPAVDNVLSMADHIAKQGAVAPAPEPAAVEASNGDREVGGATALASLPEFLDKGAVREALSDVAVWDETLYANLAPTEPSGPLTRGYSDADYLVPTTRVYEWLLAVKDLAGLEVSLMRKAVELGPSVREVRRQARADNQQSYMQFMAPKMRAKADNM